MILKNWDNAVRNPDLPFQERMFRLLVGLMLFMLPCMTIITVILGEPLANVLALAAGFVFFLTVYVIAVAKKRTDIGGIVIAAVVSLLFMPALFITGGGISGGANIWLVFCSLFVCFIVTGKARSLFIALSIAVIVGLFALSYFRPECITLFSDTVAFTDVFVSLLLATLLLSLMIVFQFRIYEMESRRSQKQAEEIEELNRAQNRFFSSMSHEIRTPINTIIGLDEMILREKISDEVYEDARQIQGAGKMLLSLVNDILDFSKIESGKMEILNVNYKTGDLLSELVNMVWVRAQEKGLQFHVDISPNVPSVLFGDEVRIKQILLNLLNNAVKYTQKGAVTLSMQCRKLDWSRVELVFSVEDTGIGMKKEHLPYLFEAFQRFDEKSNRRIEGTGLGLAIVKQLVDLMGGTISVSSIYTKGSTFTVTLVQEIIDEHELGVLNLEERHSLNEREHYKQSFEAPSARILIVDDNEANLMVAVKLLRATRMQIETAQSGMECLHKTSSAHYDVILMDHLMPEMDGIQCLHALRTQVGGLCTQTPVVALTANVESESQALYAKEGFDAYLVKPIHADLLEACVLRLLPENLVVLTQESAQALSSWRLERTHKDVIPLLVSADSICDLPEELVDKLHIPLHSYLVRTEHGEFLDRTEADCDSVLAYVADKKRHARSAAPSVESYEAFFAEQLTRAQYVVHITMSSVVSRGYTNAVKAAQVFQNVIVVDSAQLSSGTGLLVLAACHRIASENMPAAALARELEKQRAKICTSFVMESTEYLARSGRISPHINRICQALLLHPVIVIKKGRMTVGSIKFGRCSTVWKHYIRFMLKNPNRIDRRILFITYAGLSSEELLDIRAQALRRVAFENVYFIKASSAISINCGPGSFGLLFTRL